VLSETWPHWCAFTIGMRVVSKVGLFDEGYYPAYFEDKDYERRCNNLGVVVGRGPQVQHDNSSTLHTPNRDFAAVNKRSYHKNQELFDKDGHGGFDPFRWRQQAW